MICPTNLRLPLVLFARCRLAWFKDPLPPPAVHPFSWVPPDLAPGGAWHGKRAEHLRLAATCHPNPEQLLQEGIWLLDSHRSNCNLEGPDPKQLQLLWWEFPQEH